MRHQFRAINSDYDVFTSLNVTTYNHFTILIEIKAFLSLQIQRENVALASGKYSYFTLIEMCLMKYHIISTM